MTERHERTHQFNWDDHPEMHWSRTSHDLLALLSVLLIVTIIVIISMTTVEGAPVPFPRHARNRLLASSDMRDTWNVNWGGTNCVMHFDPDGGYNCSFCGMLYVGSWNLDRDNLLRITESQEPEYPLSWRDYSIRLTYQQLTTHNRPRNMKGKVEGDMLGLEISLQRQQTPALDKQKKTK